MKYLNLVLIAALFYACNNYSSTEETINTALYQENNTIADSYSSEDTIFHEIYDFEPHIVSIQVGENYGLFDTLRKVAISPVKYDHIGYFARENCINFKKNNKLGFLDTSGTEIVAPRYDFVIGFADGLAAVELNEKWGYINKKGEVVVPIEFDMAWLFKDGLGAVEKNYKWGFINTKGSYVINPIYDAVSYDFVEGGANVSIGSDHFYIDRKGKRIRESMPYKEYTQTP